MARNLVDYYMGKFGSLLTAHYSRLPLILLIASISSLIGLGIVSFMLFINGIWIPIAAPLLAFILSSGSVLIAKLVHHAFYDSLTNLPNRILFMQKLRRAIHARQLKRVKQTKKLAVLFIDIERFENINVALGYEFSDMLLNKFKTRMFRLLKPYIMLGQARMLARVGGDEFAVLLYYVTSEAEITEIAEIAENIAQGMLKSFDLQGDKIFTPVNIGIALSTQSQWQNLLQEAQTAMYRARTTGKNTPTIFETVMERDAIAHFQLERELRQAILRDKKYLHLNQDTLFSEFSVYYQPIICIATGEIIGFEALLRWKHPLRGFISPMVFIPVAEETGLIMTIGEWVLRRACHQTHLWQQQFDLPELMISVNLSAKQFAQPNLEQQIQLILAETQLSPEHLKLEITESVLMAEWETVEKSLLNFKALDIKISIDDFGTGYSSLAYLTRFPADTLKIDKSFVLQMESEPQSIAVVETIIVLAHNLKKDVIAEGVETIEQLRHLQSLGCEFGQGYLFSKPLSSEEATLLLAKKPQWQY
ncbi:MAG: EAL domain-containing protein [Thiotrichaceae bacterium]